MVVAALPVIGQHLNDPAFGDLAACASREHLLQLGAEGAKAFEAPLDLGQVSASDPIGCFAGLMRVVLQRQQLANGVDLKTKLAGMPDEAKPLRGYCSI